MAISLGLSELRYSAQASAMNFVILVCAYRESLSPAVFPRTRGDVPGDKEVLRCRYIARWKVADDDHDTLAVFKTGSQGWVGVTAFYVKDQANLDKQARRGKRVYKR